MEGPFEQDTTWANFFQSGESSNISYYMQFTRNFSDQTSLDFDELETELDNLLLSINTAYKDNKTEIALELTQRLIINGTDDGILLLRGKIQIAKAYVSRAVTKSIELKTMSYVAFFTYIQGILLAASGEYARAKDSFNTSIKTQEELEKPIQSLPPFTVLANDYLLQDNYSVAKFYFELQLQEGVFANKPKAATVLERLSIIARREGDDFTAKNYLIAILDIYQELNNKNGLAQIFSQLGEIDLNHGNYMQANDFFNKSLQIREGLEQVPAQAYLLQKLGESTFKMGNFQTSKTYYEKCLEFHISLKNTSLNGLIYSQLGAIYFRQGQFTNAENQFQQAITFYNEQNNVYELANTLHTLGELYTYLNKLPEAKEVLLESLVIQQDLRNTSIRLHTLDLLAKVSKQSRDYEAASMYLSESERIIRSFGDTVKLADVLYDLGDIYNMQGKYNQAHKVLLESLEIKELFNDTEGINRTTSLLEIVHNFEYSYESFIRGEIIQAYAKHLTEAQLIEAQRAELFYQNAITALQNGNGNQARTLLFDSLAICQDEQLGIMSASGVTAIKYQLGILAIQSDSTNVAQASLEEALVLSIELGLPLAEDIQILIDTLKS